MKPNRKEYTKGQAIKNRDPKIQAYIKLHEYGTLDQVLASNVSLEVKAACIEMAIEMREAAKQS